MLTPNVNNEWGQLKKVILGTVDGAQIPLIKDKGLHCIDYAHYTDNQFSTIPTGLYPDQVLKETEEDLKQIEKILVELGVEVYRPPRIIGDRPFNDSYYDYCPRDSMLVVKDKVIATPMTLRQRRDEADKYKQLFSPESWITFPKPVADDSLYDRSDLSRSTLMNHEPVFDAANILRANNDLLYLISNTGNKTGAEYLQRWLRDNISNQYTVHLAENVYAYIHIDTTFVFLREGLVLTNPARVNTNNMPDFLKNWHTLSSPEPYATQVIRSGVLRHHG